MKNTYSFKNLLLVAGSLMMLGMASCKKDHKSAVAPAEPTPTKLGLYEFGSDATYNYRQLQINVSKMGTQAISYGLVFDTGSGGLVIDANGILPASMITSSGFNFSGDSTVVNGITITNQKSTVVYGDDADLSTVYGNLAYAPVTIGDVNGNIVVKRLPFFLYYKATNPDGTTAPAHDFDVFGVAEIYDMVFPNGTIITSPFSYFDPGTGLTKGFKMAALGTSNFSSNGYATFVPGVLSLGLTSSDLATSSGFNMNQLNFYTGGGYLPYLQSTVTYNGKSTSSYVLFDSGTDPYNFIEDNTAPKAAALLPQNTQVSVATNSGFNYAYSVTSSESPTYLENPGSSGVNVSIFGMQFFLNNEYMLDFEHHKLGLKKD